MANKSRHDGKVTPWRSYSEYDSVICGLYHGTRIFNSQTSQHNTSSIPYSYDLKTSNTSMRLPIQPNEEEELLSSIERVALWRMRCADSFSRNERLHHSIETAASLAEILYMDARHESSMGIVHRDPIQQTSEGGMTSTNTSTLSATFAFATRHTSKHMTQMAYISTILRGVNMIADSMVKNRSITARSSNNNINSNNNSKHYNAFPQLHSVANLCSMLSLPLWIVDIRHDASHSEDLPSLPILRMASIHLLSFLYRVYFDPFAKKRDALEIHALNILCDYRLECIRLCHRYHEKERIRKKGEKVNNDDNDKKDEHNLDDIDPIEKQTDGSLGKRTRSSTGEIMGVQHNQDLNRTEDKICTKEKNLKQNPSNNDTNKKQKGCFISNNRYEILFKNTSTITKKIKKIKEGNKKPTPKGTIPAKTPLQLAKQFVDEAPIDVGYNVALSFLVWGDSRITALDQKRINASADHVPKKNSNDTLEKKSEKHVIDGELLMSPSPLLGYDNKTHKNAMFNKSYQIVLTVDEKDTRGYSTILEVIVSAWPGFLSALISNLIDMTISIIGESSPDSKAMSQNENMSDGKNIQNESDACNHFMRSDGEKAKSSRERRIDYVVSWVKYLLSRNFHERVRVCNDISVKQKKKWKGKKERKPKQDFMQAIASGSELKQFHIPLIALSDKCCQAVTNIVSTNSIESYYSNWSIHVLNELSNLFKSISEDFLSKYPRECHNHEVSLDKAPTPPIILEKEGFTPLQQNLTPLESLQSQMIRSMVKMTKHNADIERSIAWELCDTWETCAMGTIPGQPY